jgi:hypothetical protein
MAAHAAKLPTNWAIRQLCELNRCRSDTSGPIDDTGGISRSASLRVLVLRRRAQEEPMRRFFEDEDDLFRSHFTHVNQLADRSYEQVRAAYELGMKAAADPFNEGCSFADIEKDLENGWLNVRVGSGEWAAVREFVLVGFDRARQGRVPNAPSSGTTTNRPPYADPIAGDL